MEFLLKKMVYFRKHHASNKYHLVKDGFSLIELLATIAVMAILVAIIIPVIGSVRNSAKTTKSLSNLRQIASAMQMYSSDNNGFYPIGFYRRPTAAELNGAAEPYGGNPPYNGVIFWYQQISQYLDQPISPDITNSVLVSPFVAEGSFAENLTSAPCNYSVHGVICPSVSYNNNQLLPIWNIDENPAEIILVGEATSTSFGISRALFDHFSEWNFYQTSANALDSFVPTDEPAGGALSYRANNNALVAFLDGHTEALRRGTVQYRNIAIEP